MDWIFFGLATQLFGFLPHWGYVLAYGIAGFLGANALASECMSSEELQLRLLTFGTHGRRDREEAESWGAVQYFLGIVGLVSSFVIMLFDDGGRIFFAEYPGWIGLKMMLIGVLAYVAVWFSGGITYGVWKGVTKVGRSMWGAVGSGVSFLKKRKAQQEHMHRRNPAYIIAECKRHLTEAIKAAEGNADVSTLPLHERGQQLLSELQELLKLHEMIAQEIGGVGNSNSMAEANEIYSVDFVPRAKEIIDWVHRDHDSLEEGLKRIEAVIQARVFVFRNLKISAIAAKLKQHQDASRELQGLQELGVTTDGLDGVDGSTVIEGLESGELQQKLESMLEAKPDEERPVNKPVKVGE